MKNAPTTGKHAVQAEANIRNNVSFRSITHDTPDDEIQFPAHWFLFGLVSDGTAAASDAEGSRTLRPGDLLILSPSRSAALHHRSRDFRLEVVGIYANYFDTLPDGQPMYARLTRLPDGFRPPILHPDPDGFAALRSTAALFAGGLVPWVTYRRGIVRHLCSLFLLQVTELLHRTGGPGPAYVGRADEIFRLFKQAAVEHYRTHHDAAFYADRLNISTTYLSRIVKRVTGHTVYTHLGAIWSVRTSISGRLPTGWDSPTSRPSANSSARGTDSPPRATARRRVAADPRATTDARHEPPGSRF